MDTLTWMHKHKFIHEVQCVTARNNKKSKFYPLTGKTGGIISPIRFKHTFYCKKVKEYLENKAGNVELEYTPEETKFAQKRIDVALIENDTLTAYEISLSFDNLIDNIEKCNLMNAKKIIIVCESKPDKIKAQNKVSKSKKFISQNIEFKLISNFM